MTIRFLCPMGHPLAVPDNRAGKRGRCPVCRQRVFVPHPPSGAKLSDDEVANMLSESSVSDEDNDDSSVADGMIETDDDPAPPKRPSANAPTGPVGDEKTSPARARAAALRAARSKRAASRKSTGKGDSPGTIPHSDPPGDRHRWLDGLIGDWDFRVKLWLEPGGTPATSIGTANAKWTLGERFVRIESQGTLLDASFESLWTLGYDNAKRAYTSCYLDNRSTGLFAAQGDGDAAGETFRLFGDMHGWQSGQHSRAYLYVINQLHQNQWSLELHDVLLGETVMEIAYTRKK